MKRIAALILMSGFLFTNCSDNGCKPVKPEAEEGQITSYAAANGLTPTKHSTGLYYQIISPGSGPTPNINSTVYVTYTGKRLDGSIFDQTATPVSFRLQDLIDAWKIALPLIKKGGEIKLISPSAMAYGCTGVSGSVAANTVLYFDINLIDVQ